MKNTNDIDERSIKNSVNQIEMPGEMRKRIIKNCKNPDTHAYEADSSRKVLRFKPLIASCCACLLVIISAFGIWRSGLLNKDTASETPSAYNTGNIIRDDANNVNYNMLPSIGDWPVYASADELIRSSDVIVLGDVTDISYQVLDTRTAEPAAEDTDEEYCMLYTIYEFNVKLSYKGNSSDNVKIAIPGGQMNVRVEEQIEANVSEYIPILPGMPEMNLGETYLLALHQYPEHMPTILNPTQSVYNLSNNSSNEEHLNISAEEIILHFGSWKEAESNINYVN